MAHQPYRPFESLEWYRDAARNNFRDDSPRGSLGRWASGFGMLHTHICVFAVSIVLLLVINLLRSPESIWADKWIMAWTVLILIHAVAVGILWAIRQWNSDAPDEALLMASHQQWQQSGQPAWGSPGSPGSNAEDVEFRVSDAGPSADSAQANNAEDTPGWMGWNADTGSDQTPSSERASWKEASAAAWLARRNAGTTDGSDPEAESKG